uniref:Inhibitor I9 domain-containing protein n=1 Tax=Oryza punctata TaxID=4537 RepID=A0A0E0KLB2_ORYPU
MAALIVYNYKKVVSGFSARLTPSELEAVKNPDDANHAMGKGSISEAHDADPSTVAPPTPQAACPNSRAIAGPPLPSTKGQEEKARDPEEESGQPTRAH